MHAGFGIRCGTYDEKRAYFYCTCQGKHAPTVSEANRQRNKTSSRTGCKAMIRVKKEWDGYFVIKDIVWEHNHRLTLSPDMLWFLHSHKTFDSTILEYVKFLQFKGMSQSQIMNILNGEDLGSVLIC